jgi:proteic killer suppression protein
MIRRRFDALNGATCLEDLRATPGNRLEKLRRKTGFWSIRVNEQWRLIFRWKAGGAWDVELVDYH